MLQKYKKQERDYKELKELVRELQHSLKAKERKHIAVLDKLQCEKEHL